MTLRRRVLSYLVFAALASCALTVAVAVTLVRDQIAGQRMSALRTQADVLTTAAGAPAALAPGDYVFRAASGAPRRLSAVLAAAVVAAIPSGDAQGTVTVRGRALMFVARSTPGGRIVLVRSANLAFAEWRPFLGSLVLSGLGGALLALGLSYLLARRLTRPIAELAHATRKVASGESAVAVPVTGGDELSKLGTAFNHMSAELTLAREAQRQFLESVSHELKTPLTSIRGYAEGIGDGAVSPRQGAAVIGNEASRLERLVGDLLDLARLRRAGFSVLGERLDLADLAEQATARHLPRARELGLELSSSASEGALALGDADRVLQVASNLIENALRLTPAGGSVSVAARPGQIAVRDTGPGLAERDIPRAFERFYLHRRYRSEREVGSGLGLAIVKELVEAMGGSVHASARPGGGTEFVVQLPLVGPEQAEGHPL